VARGCSGRDQAEIDVKGEYAVYNASVAKLDSRIAALKARNIDFDGELALLRSLKERIAKVGLRN
jgi:hypothetical protein